MSDPKEVRNTDRAARLRTAILQLVALRMEIEAMKDGREGFWDRCCDSVSRQLEYAVHDRMGFALSDMVDDLELPAPSKGEALSAGLSDDEYDRLTERRTELWQKLVDGKRTQLPPPNVEDHYRLV